MAIYKLDGPYSNVNSYCLMCKHLTQWDCTRTTCKAYPNGIPLKIWKSFENACQGNNGYAYEEDDTVYDENAELLEDI